MALLLGRRFERGRGHQRLQARHVLDVGGDGDVVAPIGRDVVRHVRGVRPDAGGTLGLALEPPFEIDDRVSG